MSKTADLPSNARLEVKRRLQEESAARIQCDKVVVRRR